MARIIDLDRLRQPVARVRIGGNEYDVHALNGFAAQKADALDQAQKAGDRRAVLMLWEVAALILPDAPADVVQNLTVDMVTALIRAASEPVADVAASQLDPQTPAATPAAPSTGQPPAGG